MNADTPSPRRSYVTCRTTLRADSIFTYYVKIPLNPGRGGPVIGGDTGAQTAGGRPDPA